MKQENEKLRDKLREKEQDIADLQDKITKVQSRLAHTMVQLSITRSLSGSDL
jgi:predicted  nucleic acid-binding Zn-ribbon protein